MLHGAIRTPDELLLVPIALGYIGVAILSVVLVAIRWLETPRGRELPRARVRSSDRHRLTQ